ncbi:hypothetical protein GCM10022404_18480 [Celeribacter arenosi]|uniref:Uncharacterized protein n=2 Tax=Celeribacter arenosi TaxID=792649 RepID=A0ABP7K7X8_9RHOB
MAYQGASSLEQRVMRIEAHKSVRGRGVVPNNHDELIIARSRRTANHRTLRIILLTISFGFVFKATMFALLGAATYADRVAKLAAGSFVERACAWVMTADPATIWVAIQIKMLMP